jgi:capsular polysaccharide biosynthesis protein
MDDYQLTLADYIAILRRRAWLIIGSFFGMLVLGVAVTLLLPSIYRATGSILIESQQIPTDLVQATVTSYADERIEVIKQRVMTRDNLLRIIRKYNLFADAGPTFTPSDQIDEMRKTISVDLVNANLRSDRRGAGTIAFSLSFEHKRPEVAQAVANDLVTLFLEENVKQRTQRATQTTEFLTQEADKLKKDLDALESQIATYKQQNGKGLPENVAFGLAAMQRLEGDLRQLDRDYASTEQELRGLEAEREAAANWPAGTSRRHDEPGRTAARQGGSRAAERDLHGKPPGREGGQAQGGGPGTGHRRRSVVPAQFRGQTRERRIWQRRGRPHGPPYRGAARPPEGDGRPRGATCADGSDRWTWRW